MKEYYLYSKYHFLLKKRALKSRGETISYGSKDNSVTIDRNSCICNEEKTDVVWIQCNTCQRWYHITCVSITQNSLEALQQYANEPYICDWC